MKMTALVKPFGIFELSRHRITKGGIGVAYRITYGQADTLLKWENIAIIKAQCMAALSLFLVLLTVSKMVPDCLGALRMLFLPGEGTATEAMADILYGGGTFRQGLIVFCRRVLECAGYGS